MTKLEHILTNSYKSGMVSYLNSHPEDFEEAVELAIGDKQPYSWRAASLVWKCMEKNDQRIKGYLEKIIESIPTKRDGHARELLIILQQMELEEDQEGKVFDICMSIWEKIGKQPSVRYHAFKQLSSIAKKYPELLNEIAFLTESMYMDPLSAGVKRGVIRMTKGLGLT